MLVLFAMLVVLRSAAGRRRAAVAASICALTGSGAASAATRYGAEERPRIVLPPLYWEGPDYKVCPPLLSGWWRRADGAESTWITPLFHKTVDSAGGLRHMHMLNYFQGPGYKILFPFAYRSADYAGVVPFFFQGPNYKVIPPALSGWWRHADGSESTWITPLFHRTVDAHGSLRDTHLFPFVWHWRREGGSRTLVPLVWWSSRPAPQKPARFHILGGLIARDCDYERGIHRYRLLWMIPLGRWKDSETGRAWERPPSS